MLDISFGVELALNIVLTAIHVTGIGLTIFRFRYRANTQRLWWDDWIALFAMLVDCVYITILWFDYAQQDSILQTHEVRVALYWLGLMLFLTAVWAIRISLALAIARIWPPRDPTRMFAIGMAFMSVAFCAIVIVRSVTLCAHQPALVSGPDAACHWSLDLRVLVVAANITSDALLVAVPLYKLWRVRLNPRKRRLILGAFTASSCTTAATLLCGVFQFTSENLEPAKTILIEKFLYFETGISLVVCNLLVVVTYLHVRTHRDTDTDSGSSGGCGSSSSSNASNGRADPSSNNAATECSNTATLTLTEISGCPTWSESDGRSSTRLADSAPDVSRSL
ncbi:hypothetical protein D9619_006254 [Psilocybe cf. subviscida]|uniref:Rhodopsin domain-containing protein n=1 Tax=Psilocybe cf. subviscida TaxID=2480587 RepID=A0A8H5EXN7_9AGAR|nr:hypothetical protein D9619_006254 [Psilocybe cf. subviscida]